MAATPAGWLRKRREARRLLGPSAALAAFTGPPPWYRPPGARPEPTPTNLSPRDRAAPHRCSPPAPGAPPYALSPSLWLRAQRLPRPPSRPKRTFMQLALRQGYRCAGCRDLLHPDSQADHIVPWSLSADDREDNIQLLCPNCHAAKSGAEAGRIRAARAMLADLAEAGRGARERRRVCWGCLEYVACCESRGRN